MASKTFTCRQCSTEFSVRDDVLARFPGWQPSICLPCKNKSSKTAPGAKKPPAKKKRSRRRTKPPEDGHTTAQVLEKYTEGPQDGVFTDGACTGNPGPGGWGAVWVKDGEVHDRRYGSDAHTTNNRMELLALIEAYKMIGAEDEVTLWSDSNLCVKTLNEWAAGWQRLGWKRKTGPVENLELVQEAWRLKHTRPKASLRWIKAHNGCRWNEYADALATAFQRDEV